MDKLDEIMAWKRKEIASRIRPVHDRELERFGAIKRKGPSMSQALDGDEHLSVIAEIKRRSPSAGDIAQQANAVEQARRYLNADVDAMSVLTDEKFFGGTLQDLWDVTDFLQSRSAPPPALRKDFMVHPVQIIEAAESGASCILIIVRALSDDECYSLYECATAAGLDCLFEVHNQRELDRALDLNPKILGVNNRDLGNFTTDLAISEQLIPQIPRHIIAVSESGIFDAADAARAKDCGARAVLVGQALMECATEQALEDLVAAIQSV